MYGLFQERSEKRPESCVTALCRHVMEAAAQSQSLPDFTKRGLVGDYLDRIWKEVVAMYTEQKARDLFLCSDLSDVRGTVTAVALVSIQHVPFGPLAVLDWEERFFWEYYNRTPCVPLKIEHVLDLTSLGTNVARAVVSSRNQAFFSKLHPGLVDQLCALPDVQSFFLQHGVDVRPAGVVGAGLAMQLWPPVAYLVASKKWTFIAMGGFQKRLGGFVPAPFREAWQAARDLYVPNVEGARAADAELANPLSLRELAENVRAWATFLLHNQAFDADDQAFKLEAAVHLFEEKADKLEELRKQCWMETFGRHGFQRRFKMVQLLRLIVLVRDIRTATRTKQVLVAALGSIFPAEEMSFLQQVINDGSLVPGKSVLYNMRFIVDMGFMLHMRGVLHEVFGSVSAADMQQPAVYLLVDSSPQGGKNLLNSEYDLIAADNMLRLGDVFLAIRETLQVLHAGGMSGSEEQEFLDEHDALLEQGQSMIYHHFNIPVVLGSNHSTLLHEFVALQHAVFMEAGSSAVLANWNKHVVSTTTDRGTEKAFVRVPAMTFRTAFPFFLPEDSLQFEVDAGEAPQVGQAQPDRMGPHAPASVTPEDLLCMDGALDVAGPMHALGNASKGFVHAVPNYEEYFYPRLNALVRFLHAPYYRSLFSHKCLTGNLEPLQDLFTSFPWTIVQWRWLSLSAVVPELLLRQHALQAGWDPAAMGIQVQQQGEGNDNPDDFHNMSWDLVGSAIQHDLFWAWLRMLSVLTAVLGYLEKWFFACPCHAETASFENLLRVVQVPLHHRDRNGDQERGSKQGCPFRRRRGPELASGDFLRMVEQLLAAGNQEIAGRIVGHLTPQEQAKVVEDFEGAKQHLLFRMRVQFVVWTSLPRLLVGMCHPDEREGRRCAAQALIQFRGYSPAQKQQAHFLTRRFCDPGHAAGSLRLFMTQFIGGATLISLPVLRFHALRLAFIPICEMSVERMHAVTKSVITHGSHSASLPSLSLGNRWPEFLRALQQPNRFQWFADTCMQVYHPLRACPVFGIVQHPDLAAAFQGVEDISLLNLLGSTFKWSKTVKGIIYRSNFHLQFQDVSSCKKPPEEPRVEVAPLAVPVPDKLEDQLLNIEAMQTFTEVLGPGTFYSVPIRLRFIDSVSELVVVPLMDRLQSAKATEWDLPEWLQIECEVDRLDMEVDVTGIPNAPRNQREQGASIPRQCQEADHMFFQVLSRRPGRVKQDRATGVGFGIDDVAVTRHACLKLMSDVVYPQGKVYVEAMPSPGAVCLEGSLVPEEEFNWILPRSQASHLREALVWNQDDSVQCVVDNASHNWSPDVVTLLESCVECKALPGTGFVLLVEDCGEQDLLLLKRHDPELFCYVASLFLVRFSCTVVGFLVKLFYLVVAPAADSSCLVISGAVTSFLSKPPRCFHFGGCCRSPSPCCLQHRRRPLLNSQHLLCCMPW